MNEINLQRAHWSFWGVGIVLIIWNAMGAINFIMQMNPDMVLSMPDSHRSIVESRPLWATVGFAVTVFGGLIGCILLFLKKKSATYVFIASFIGVIITMSHVIFMADGLTSFSLFEVVLAVILPVLVAIFLIWYSRYSLNKGWIG